MISDTIVAVSTAYGRGAIAVIRVSGCDCFEICSRVISSKVSIKDIKDKKIIHGNIKNIEGADIDDALIIAMRGPFTFTGEDTIEINCHGGIIVTRNVLAAVLAAGARQAGAGEFSQRAFMNGKLDLASAEGIINLIDARTSLEAKTALNLVKGQLSDKINSISDKLIDISAELMAFIDYPEEDLQETPLAELLKQMILVNKEIKKLISSYDTGSVIKEGIDTVIVGTPNVGKSSVMNILSKNEISIVTDIAGTTRDIVRDNVNIGNVVLNLMDTAGIHETFDVVETIGVERSFRAIDEAQLILAVFDASCELSPQDFEIINKIKDKKAIALINKTDLDIKLDAGKIHENFDRVINISCASAKREVNFGEDNGFDKLYKCIEEMFIDEELTHDGAQIITSARHYEALIKADKALCSASESLERGMTCDIASMDLEAAIEALGEITGRSASEDIVARIFQNFCVGK